MNFRTIFLTLMIPAGLHTVFAPVVTAQDQQTDPNDRVQYAVDEENKHVDDQPAPPKHESATSILRSVSQDSSSVLNDLPQPEREFKLYDVIKIRVSESSIAKDSATMRTERSFDVNAALDEYFQLTGKTNGVLPKFTTPNDVSPSLDFTSSLERDNRGTMNKASSFETVIAAQVIDIKPNGTMVVTAEKSIVINEERQSLCLTGIVSKNDVTAENIVDSSDLVDLNLEYQGEGPVNDLTKRGLMGRIFDTIWPFK